MEQTWSGDSVSRSVPKRRLISRFTKETHHLDPLMIPGTDLVDPGSEEGHRILILFSLNTATMSLRSSRKVDLGGGMNGGGDVANPAWLPSSLYEGLWGWGGAGCQDLVPLVPGSTRRKTPYSSGGGSERGMNGGPHHSDGWRWMELRLRRCAERR